MDIDTSVKECKGCTKEILDHGQFKACAGCGSEFCAGCADPGVICCGTVVGCGTCAAYKGAFGPSHKGSGMCRMGTSIAAGGTVAHCTCNACF